MEGQARSGYGRGERRRRVIRPDQDGPVLIGRESLALDKLVCERFQVRVIELKLQLESPIRQAAPLAQERDRLIHDRDKVHPLSSLPGAQPLYTCTIHHSIGDRERAERSTRGESRGDV